MKIPGIWTQDKNRPPRPTVSAFFKHKSLKKDVPPIEFIIDTASDRTLILPYHEKLLGVSEESLRIPTQPVQTVVGPVPFKFLQHCSLVFESDHGIHQISNLDVYFAGYAPEGVLGKLKARLTGGARRRFGEGELFSVLGRDVVQQLAMAYCNPHALLFLTTKTTDYRDALTDAFPDDDVDFDSWID